MSTVVERGGLRLSDAGSATAELAVALPAVAVVLAACVWGVQLAAVQVRLQDAAGLAARSAARGDDTSAAASVMPGAAVATRRDGDLVCAVVGVEVRSPIGTAPLHLTAESCAVAESP